MSEMSAMSKNVLQCKCLQIYFSTFQNKANSTKNVSAPSRSKSAKSSSTKISKAASEKVRINFAAEKKLTTIDLIYAATEKF